MSSLLERKRRALIMGSGGWWLPPNFDPEDCVCAYQFKGAVDEATALSDLSGNGYTLTKQYQVPENAAWNNDSGFYLGGFGGTTWRVPHGLDNSSVNRDQIKSVIVRFKEGNVASIAYSIFYRDDTITMWFGHNPTICQTSDSITRTSDYQVIGHNIGWNRESHLSEFYKNGSSVANNFNYTNYDAKTYVMNLFGGSGAQGNIGGVTIVGGAFYKRWMTDAEMSYISDQLAAI